MCRDDVQPERVLPAGGAGGGAETPTVDPRHLGGGATLALLVLEENNHRLDLQPALLWGGSFPRAPHPFKKKRIVLTTRWEARLNLSKVYSKMLIQ